MNVDIPLHIIVPKDTTLKELFVCVCAEYSKSIQEQKMQSFTTSIKQQMFDILSSTVQSEKTQHVNNLRFLHYTHWTEHEVSKLTNKIFETEKNLEN